MYARRAGGNAHGIRRFGAEYVAGGSDELTQHHGGRLRRRRFEMVTCRGERALEWRGEREAAETRLERLEPAAVVLGADGRGREDRFGGAYHQPQGEQPVPLRTPGRFRDQRDESLLGSGRRPYLIDHATSRSIAAAT